MRHPAALFVVPAMLLALAGCSSQGQGADAKESTPTVSAVPTGPTVKQFASVVARSKAELEESANKLESCSFPQGIQAVTCSLEVKTATLRGQIAAKNLRAVGTPPVEIAQLVTDTLKVADQLGANDVSACDSGEEDSPGCAGTLTRVRTFLDSTLTTLAGWQPYSN